MKNNTELPAVALLIFWVFIIKNVSRQITTHNLQPLTKYDKTNIYSFFALPTRKTSKLFLRAPYKNKLARLSILRLEYSTIVSIKHSKYLFKQPYYVFNNARDFIHLVGVFTHYNLSTYKIKHSKTSIWVDSFMPQNFVFNYYI